MVITPLSPEKIIELCFATKEEVKDELLIAYRQQTNGEKTEQARSYKIKLLEKILAKLESIE